MCPIFCIRSAIKTVCMSLNRVMASASLIIQLNLFGLKSISREIWKLKITIGKTTFTFNILISIIFIELLSVN
jgi:hypothetical protein